MQKIEDFINSRFAEELAHIADGIDQPKPEPFWSDDTGAKLLTIAGGVAGVCSVEYWKQREAEAVKLRERLSMTGDGEAFVRRVDDYAAKYGIDWIDAARICSFAEMNESFGAQAAAIRDWLASPVVRELVAQLNKAFANIAEAVAKGLADAGIGDVFDQPPRNRHERRARKHRAPLEPDDPDQRWKNRDFRSRRDG